MPCAARPAPTSACPCHETGNVERAVGVALDAGVPIAAQRNVVKSCRFLLGERIEHCVGLSLATVFLIDR